MKEGGGETEKNKIQKIKKEQKRKRDSQREREITEGRGAKV